VIKPPYKVPSMVEIKALDWNGFNVVSTFSGCGGSCLGYRMAGYRVLYANEFIPLAQEVYKLNHPDSILDTRDVRIIQPEEILAAIAMKSGELDLLDGSPPCSAFSTCGTREAGWGKEKQYSDTSQRVDDLFFEYTRLLRGIQPKVFVAENVSGLVKGTAKGYFKEILAALKDCGYKVKCQLLEANWLGVPQKRQRVIFIGVRNDLPCLPVHPKPLSYQYVIKDALIDVPLGETRMLNPSSATYKLWIRTKHGGCLGDTNERLTGSKTMYTHYRTDPNATCKTITTTEDTYHFDEPRCLSIPELKRICGFPDDFELIGGFSKQWERLGRAVPPVMMAHIAKTVEREILSKCVA
jgi:DNA (cytosine-5)-methyltransferase 1